MGNCVCCKELFLFLEIKNIKFRFFNLGLVKVLVSIVIVFVFLNIIFLVFFGEYLEVMKGVVWLDSSDFVVRVVFI